MPVYASDLPRALETARLIAAQWLPARAAVGEAPGTIAAEAPGTTTAEAPGTTTAEAPGTTDGVVADCRLREIRLGDYEGRSWDEFVADGALTAAFTREPLLTALPGGESLAALRERAVAAFDEIVRGDHAAVCLVAHDGPIRAILNHVLRVSPERHWAISTNHGGLSLLETSGDWTSVRFVNDTSHLRGLTAPDAALAPAGDTSGTDEVAVHDDELAVPPIVEHPTA